jgi:hypothetical protein
MAVIDIKWEKTKLQGPDHHEWLGTVSGKLVFIIERRGVRQPKFFLFSYPMRNPVFPNANNTRKLAVDSDFEFLKKKAQGFLESFVDIFVKPEPFDAATLAMLTLYHKQANPEGISVEEVDTLLTIATKFENKYKELNGKDWHKAKITWEDAIINFYNEHRPSNWNPIT